MAEGTPVQKHLNDFNSIIVDLESLYVKVEDEDKAILLVVSLPRHINILRRSCYIVILILFHLRMLSKEKFDHDIHADSIEGLVVRVEQLRKERMVGGERTVLSVEILMQIRPAISMVN